MNACIFTGPTLAPEQGRAEFKATYLPPVSHGDVYRVTQLRPVAVGIVDGYFERVPAVWHKEILWAMNEGIRVYGSASMGALRASELAAFGMIGVGKVFEWYRDGVIERDDEVAVVHGPAESGYKAHSEALVNIRCTLAAAETDSVVSHAARLTLEALAQETFFKDRSYPLLLSIAQERALVAAEELQSLRDWLSPTGRCHGGINQKREDALAMVHQMRLDMECGHPAPVVQYAFERTIWWDHLERFAGTLRPASASGRLISVREEDAVETLTLDSLIEEMQIDPATYERAHDGALLRLLLLREAAQSGYSPTPSVLEELVMEFRRTRALDRPCDVAGWLEANDLDDIALVRLIRSEALIARTRAVLERDVIQHLPDHLRVIGEYGPLTERAVAKQSVLTKHGLQNPGLRDVGISCDDLMRWYFARVDMPVPASISRYATEAGFASQDAFQAALMREFLYLRHR